MKSPLFFYSALGITIIGLSRAISVTVGDDADQMPAGPAESLDGALPLVVIDYQANPYNNISGLPETFSVDTFEFYAQGGGDVTPFVALLNGTGVALADYDVVAVGDQRVGGGVDFNVGEVVSVPFAEAPTEVIVPVDGTLVGGIHMGTTGVNVVPFNANSGFNTYITNGPSVTVETDATAGGSTWTSLNGGRNYEFIIELNPAGPDTDGDGLPDQWEEDNGLDPEDNGDIDPNNGAEGDPDNDGLNNLGEYANGSDPNDPDSDDDTLQDNDEVQGAGERPPTLPNNADSDGDGLDDAAETNTGTFASATDTGTDPRNPDSDGDGVSDNDEVTGNNAFGFTSDPNIADTDGDGSDDGLELIFGTDPRNPGDFPTAIFIGDDAPEFTAVTDLGNADTANAGNITYALAGFPYINLSGGAEELDLLGVNFWADSVGDVTPFVASYNGLGFASAANFTVLAVGDPITSVPGEANNAAFTTAGEPASIIVEDGDTLIAGFHQTSGVVPFGEPGDAVADYLDEDYEIGAVGSTLIEDAQWSSLNRTYAFNIALQPGSTVPFAITDVAVDLALSSATITWNSRTGRNYAVDASDDLIIWNELDDGVGSQGANTSFTESPLPPNAKRRHWRVRDIGGN